FSLLLCVIDIRTKFRTVFLVRSTRGTNLSIRYSVKRIICTQQVSFEVRAWLLYRRSIAVSEVIPGFNFSLSILRLHFNLQIRSVAQRSLCLSFRTRSRVRTLPLHIYFFFFNFSQPSSAGCPARTWPAFGPTFPSVSSAREPASDLPSARVCSTHMSVGPNLCLGPIFLMQPINFNWHPKLTFKPILSSGNS
ncbi:Unknown protein, partial [Striga hermonthica]